MFSTAVDGIDKSGMLVAQIAPGHIYSHVCVLEDNRSKFDGANAFRSREGEGRIISTSS